MVLEYDTQDTAFLPLDDIFLFNSRPARTIHDGAGNEFFLSYALSASMPCCHGHYNGHYFVSHTKWQAIIFSFLLMLGKHHCTFFFLLLWPFVRALSWRVSAQQLAQHKGLGAPGVASAPKD